MRLSDLDERPRPQCDKTPVSVIVPVKNEAENLRRCLPALAWADEVFVVDSQSTDETAEVAARFGAQVVQFHFNGTYPKKKNWALENLPFRNEWVLIVDADEVVVPELADGDRPADRRRRGRRLLPELTLLLPRPAHPPLRVFVVLEPAAVQAPAGPLREDARSHRRPRRRQRGPRARRAGRARRCGSRTSSNTTPTRRSPSGSRSTIATPSGRPRSPIGSSSEPIPTTIGSVQRFKRRLKKIAWRLPLRPLVRFLYAYVLRLGFLDGKPGLFFCGLLAFYDFLAMANRYEQRINEGRLNSTRSAGTAASPDRPNRNRPAHAVTLPIAARQAEVVADVEVDVWALAAPEPVPPLPGAYR